MFPEPFSLKRLEKFVGRETIVNQVRGWLEDGQFHPVFFSGGYGIGKTRLLEQIRDLAIEELKYDGGSTHLIDLYHFHNHSPEGLARAIFACFKDTKNKHFFKPFITASEGLDAARVGGDSRESHEQLKKLLKACADGVKKMSIEHGVLLLFDTVELFVYPTGARFAPAWDWLKSWIGDLPRGAALFAGRTTASPLFDNFSFTTIPLDFFTLEECRAYILKAWEKLTEQENSEPFDENEISTLHKLSQGRPILLAIFLELRMRQKLQKFIDLPDLETKGIEENIINYLRTEFGELGETLNAVGRTRKGINAELLANIRDSDNPQIQDAEKALEELQGWIFTKTFSNDNRVFLHDEMYGLCKKYIYDVEAEGPAADQQNASEAIHKYYTNAIRKKDEELKGVLLNLTHEGFERSAQSSENYISAIREIETTRQHLKAEFVHYRLRNQVKKEGKRKWYEDDPIFAGLKIYYRYGHEAATSNNDEILIPLQIELTNFWLELDDNNFWKPFIEGLLLIHEIWLKGATGQNYWDDILNLENNLASITSLSSDQKDILHNLLETWRGTGLVYGKSSEHDHAETILTNVIDKLKAISVDDRLRWFRDVAISFALRQRGYLHRTRYMFQNAIEDYQSGLRYSRSANFIHEEATLRNDLGFSQMHMGYFQYALGNMRDGLQMRYRTAIGPRIALSHSSLAHHYIAIGAFEESRNEANSAINISEVSKKVGYWRGRNFGYLALAEATRRFAFSFPDIPRQKEYLQLAQKAISKLNQDVEALEASREIDLKLEEACIYRDLTRVEDDLLQRQGWFEKSAQLLWEVSQKAKDKGINYRLVDVMCNRVWLGYFSDNIDFAMKASSEFEKLDILTPYWFSKGKYKDEKKAKSDPIIWSHIGKYYMARGVISLRNWKEKSDEASLTDAARYLMMSLEYSTEFAPEYRGLHEGRHRIFQELNRLSVKTLKQFCGFVLVAAQNEKIRKKKTELQKAMEHHALWIVD